MLFVSGFRDSDRNKTIKLLLKIVENLINRPTEIHKYGDLSYKKIKQKLSKCKPGLDLLYLSGFQKSGNDKRLIWKNTNNNVKMLKHIQHELKSIFQDNNNQNNNSFLMISTNNMSKQVKSFDTQQTQQVFYHHVV